MIGIDIAAGERQQVSGVVAGATRPDYLHDMEVEVGEIWKQTRIGFMPDLSANGYGLLGQAGFFDRFSFVKFEHPRGTLELGSEVR